MLSHISSEVIPNIIFDRAEKYASHELFQRDAQSLQLDNPWSRRLPIPESGIANYTAEQIAAAQEQSHASLSTPMALFNNRVLLTIYERDFVLLPKQGFQAAKLADFNSYYGDELTVLGEQARLGLEHSIFPALEENIAITGEWTLERFRNYYQDFARSYKAEEHNKITQRVIAAPDPKLALQFYLTQAACDFLVESSAMARNTIGNYGVVQSEFFKILIDESGYGVHESRHSTLFEKVMQSVGLDATPHTYWDYYLPSTLLTANYYNYCGKNHLRIFRYLGALLHVETCFKVTCGQMAKMMQSIEGSDAEVRYFVEHVHIDDHHSRMAFEKIIEPAVKKFGEWALKEVIIGFEESRQISDLHSKGMMWQLNLIERIQSRTLSSEVNTEKNASAVVTLKPNQKIELPISPVTTSIRILSGELKISAMPNCSLLLKPKQIFDVPAGSLCKLSTEQSCVYECH